MSSQKGQNIQNTAEKDSKITERFWQVVEAHGLSTYKEIAGKMGIHETTVRRLVNGERHWTKKMRLKAAVVFGVSAQWLETGLGDPAYPSNPGVAERSRPSKTEGEHLVHLSVSIRGKDLARLLAHYGSLRLQNAENEPQNA